MKRWKKIVLLFTGIFAIVMLYAWTEFNREHKDTANLKPDFRMEASGLITAFQENETAANHLYNDKVVTISGIVSKIIKDSILHVLVTGTDPMAGILCQFEPGSVKEVNQLSPGQKIEIKGVCTGFLIDVVLVRCVFNNL